MSVASSEEKPYLMGIEKIRFLYLSTSADQASSLPPRHSLTRRVSGHAARFSSSDWDLIWPMKPDPRPPNGCKAGQHSRARTDPESRAGNFRRDPWPRQEYWGSRGKLRANSPRQFPEPGHTGACASPDRA